MGKVWRAFVLVVMSTLLVVACSMNSPGGGGQSGNGGGQSSNGGGQSSNGGGQSQSHHYQLNAENQCRSATGEGAVCTVTITNDASSTDDFGWEATSDPNVASIDPSSGTVPRGSSSNEITVTVPSGSPCPVTVTFADSSTNGSTSIQVTSVDGSPC